MIRGLDRRAFLIKSALVVGSLATNTNGLSQTNTPDRGIPPWLWKHEGPEPDLSRLLTQPERNLLTDLFPFESGIYSIVLAKESNDQNTALGLPHGYPEYAEKMIPRSALNQQWHLEKTEGPDPQSFYIHNGNRYLRAEALEGAALKLAVEPTAWIVEMAADKVADLGNFTIRMAGTPELVIDYAPDLTVLLKTNIYRPHNLDGKEWQIWTLNKLN